MLSPAALAALHEGLNEILDLVVAYRTACEGRGFSPSAAEAMALEYHRMLLAQAMRRPADGKVE